MLHWIPSSIIIHNIYASEYLCFVGFNIFSSLFFSHFYFNFFLFAKSVIFIIPRNSNWWLLLLLLFRCNSSILISFYIQIFIDAINQKCIKCKGLTTLASFKNPEIFRRLTFQVSYQNIFQIEIVSKTNFKILLQRSLRHFYLKILYKFLLLHHNFLSLLNSKCISI